MVAGGVLSGAGSTVVVVVVVVVDRETVRVWLKSQDGAGAKALYRQPGNVLHFSPAEGFTPQPKKHNSFST